MRTLSEGTKEKLSKVSSFLDRFFHSDYYIALVALLIFIGWFTGILVPFLLVGICLNIVMFFVCRDTTPLFAFLWFFLCGMSASGEDIGKYGWAIAFFVPLIASIVYNLLKYKPDFKAELRPATMRVTTLSYLLLLVSFLLSGIGKSGRHWGGAALAFVLIFVLTFAYIYYLAAYKKSGLNKNDLLVYMIKIMFAYGILVTLQLAVDCIRTGSFEGFMELAKYKLLDLGWASSNPAAAAIALGIPANFYYMLKKKKTAFVFLLIAAAEYVAIVITGSRGVLLFAGLALPIMYIYTMIKTENRKQLLAVSAVLFAGAVAVGVVFFDKIIDAFSVMLGKGLDDNGRFEIYWHGLEVFARNPVFGAGWDYGIGSQHVSYTPYLFHSTLIQIIACAGIFGLAVFVYFYWARYSAFFKGGMTKERLAVLAGMVIFEAYAMIDPVLFIPPTFFIMFVTLAYAAEVSVPGELRLSKTAQSLYQKWTRYKASRKRSEG